MVDDCEWLEPGDDLLVELVDDERGDGRTKGGEGVLAEIVVGALEEFAAKAVVSGPTDGYGSTERSPVKAGAARFAEMTDGDESKCGTSSALSLWSNDGPKANNDTNNRPPAGITPTRESRH